MIKVYEPDGTEWAYEEANDGSALENGMLLIAENLGDDHIVPRASWANGAWTHIEYELDETPCEVEQNKLRRQILFMEKFLQNIEQFENFIEWAGDKYDGSVGQTDSSKSS